MTRGEVSKVAEKNWATEILGSDAKLNDLG